MPTWGISDAPSESTIGQIYVPWINWLLMVSVLTLVFAFQSSAALAYAFGMAVAATITTLLFFYVAHTKWRTPLWLVLLGAIPLLTIDALFLAANLTKLIHGAWLPLLIGVTAFTVMITWPAAVSSSPPPARRPKDHYANSSTN